MAEEKTGIHTETENKKDLYLFLHFPSKWWSASIQTACIGQVATIFQISFYFNFSIPSIFISKHKRHVSVSSGMNEPENDSQKDGVIEIEELKGR